MSLDKHTHAGVLTVGGSTPVVILLQLFSTNNPMTQSRQKKNLFSLFLSLSSGVSLYKEGFGNNKIRHHLTLSFGSRHCGEQSQGHDERRPASHEKSPKKNISKEENVSKNSLEIKETTGVSTGMEEN